MNINSVRGFGKSFVETIAPTSVTISIEKTRGVTGVILRVAEAVNHTVHSEGEAKNLTLLLLTDASSATIFLNVTDKVSVTNKSRTYVLETCF